MDEYNEATAQTLLGRVDFADDPQQQMPVEVRANSASRSLRRALLTPQVNPGGRPIAAATELKSGL